MHSKICGDMQVFVSLFFKTQKVFSAYETRVLTETSCGSSPHHIFYNDYELLENILVELGLGPDRMENLIKNKLLTENITVLLGTLQ